jgi:hypothetical protein
MNDQHQAWGVVLLLLLVFIGVTANFLLTLTLREQVKGIQQAPSRRPGLPCAAIPTRLILEDPACAQKLLTAMNVTNFRVLTNASQLSGLDPAMKDRLAELGMPVGGNRSRGP